MSEVILQGDGMTRESPRISWPAIHGGILLLAFCPIVYLQPLPWPLYLLVPLAGYLLVVLLAAAATDDSTTFARQDRSRRNRGAVALSVVASGVLLGCHAVFHPDVSSLAAHLPPFVFRYTLIAGVCFCTVNAVLEELLCRWVLYDAVAAEWGGFMAVLVTSVFFGLGHWNGYPPGWMARSGGRLRGRPGAAAPVERRTGAVNGMSHLRGRDHFLDIGFLGRA